MKPSESELIDALATVGERTLTLYAEHAQAGRMRWHGTWRLEVSEDGHQTSLAQGAEPFARGMLSDADLQGLLSEEPIRTAMRTLWDAEYFAPVEMSRFPGGERIAPTFENTLDHNLGIALQIVSDFVGEAQPSIVERGIVAAFMLRRRERWASETVRWEASIPVLYFASAALPFDLGGGIRLEHFDATTKSHMWHPLQDGWGRLTIEELRYSGARVVMSADVPRSDPNKTGGDPGPAAWCAITALRLLKPGPIGASVIVHREIWPHPDGRSSVAELPEFYLPAMTLGRYNLAASEVEPFKALYDMLASARTTARFKPVALCLRRFNLSYSRDHRDDRIIDLVIALEGSLLFGDNQELRYKTAFRGAAILAASHDPAGTAMHLRRLYDLRSKIVHDGLTLEEVAAHKDFGWLRGMGLDGYLMDVESLVRAILCQYVERVAGGVDVRTVNDRLDQSVLEGLKQT